MIFIIFFNVFQNNISLSFLPLQNILKLMNTENINIQIKTFFGLENILAEEVKKLGGRNVEIKN